MINADLEELEAEAIWAIRETKALFRRQILLYSIGKDSTVLLELCRRAFAPAPLPFPVLHIDTTWKFREMIQFRDRVATEPSIQMHVHTNQDGARGGITPFTTSSTEYTRIMKTVALRQALDQLDVDVALGGARRDEERSRAKERIFSVRAEAHSWKPEAQRPEFWETVNPHLAPGHTMRVFPLSNWTEIDTWRYIDAMKLEVPQLYFTRPRPTIIQDGKIIVIDDDRFPLAPGQVPQLRNVRFRTLGCYPLSAAVESKAYSVPDIIRELQASATSERAGRLIDGRGAASMEAKKKEGYF